MLMHIVKYFILIVLISGCDGFFLIGPPPEPFVGALNSINEEDPVMEEYVKSLSLQEQHKFFRYCVQATRPAKASCCDNFASNGQQILPLVYQGLLIEEDAYMKEQYLFLIEETIRQHRYCPDVELLDFIKRIAGSMNREFPITATARRYLSQYCSY